MWDHVSSFCRVCLSTNDPQFSFESNLIFLGQKFQISELFSNLLDNLKFELGEEELSGSSICNTCLKDFEVFLKLKITCLESHKILQRKKETLAVEQQLASGNEKNEGYPNENLGDPLNEEDLHWICDNCGKSFESKTSMRSHIVRKMCNKNTVPNPKYLTGQDQKKIRRKLTSIEAKNSSSFSSVQCNLCPEVYPTIKAFLQHMSVMHGVDKFYKCDGCCRSFSTVNKLRSHKKTFHNEEKNFQCQECGQFFKCEKSLKYHTINIHKPEDKLSCSKCSEKFVFQTQLNHHFKRDHLKVKGYACSLCNRTYIRPKDCRDHIAGNHMNFVLKCPYCPVQSTQKPRYKYHLYKFHRNEETYKDVIKQYQRIERPNVEMYMKKVDTPIIDKKN